jgi:hypothetical protein
MRPPTLTLRPSARAALLAHMASITEFRPVASVVWIIAGSSGRLDPCGSEHFEFFDPHWSVGFSNAERFPEGTVSEIDGIPFRARWRAAFVALDRRSPRLLER